MFEKSVESHYIYRGKILNLRKDRVLLPDGQTGEREIVEHVQSVGIIALDDDSNILMVRQYRHPAQKLLLEIPAGCIDSGEKPGDTVSRELREETGFSARSITRLGGFYLSPGYADEYMHIFLATGLDYDPLIAEDTESIELETCPVRAVLDLIDSGRIEDCKTIAAILMFVRRNQG